MNDIDQGDHIGVEDALLAERLSEWGYSVDGVDSSRAVAIVATTVDGAIAAQIRGLPFLLDAGVPRADAVLEALGAPGYAFRTPGDLRRGLMVLERRGWTPVGPVATVSGLLDDVGALHLWLERMRRAEVEAQQAHARSTEATARHIDGLERQRAALEEHRDSLLARIDELTTINDAIAKHLAGIENSRGWRVIVALRRQRDWVLRRGSSA